MLSKKKQALFLFFFIISANGSVEASTKKSCSDAKAIEFASQLAVGDDFVKAQRGMNILLSLQSKQAKKALDKLKITGTAQHELRDQYLTDYDKKPKTDNAGDPITYFTCDEIRKLMKEGGK